jgi:hypothetical protein
VQWDVLCLAQARVSAVSITYEMFNFQIADLMRVVQHVVFSTRFRN